jgi:hypothetical protein
MTAAEEQTVQILGRIRVGVDGLRFTLNIFMLLMIIVLVRVTTLQSDVIDEMRALRSMATPPTPAPTPMLTFNGSSTNSTG